MSPRQGVTTTRSAALRAGVLALLGIGALVLSTREPHAPQQPPLSTAASAAAPAQPTAPVATPHRQPLALRSSVPLALSVPAIGVRTALLQLGQAADGSLAVPPPGPTYDQAGWYRYSPTPGALGPAVIVGHVDSTRSGPSVFYRLGELQRGDEVRVTREDGSVATFTVEQMRRFAKSDFPTQLVYGDTDHAALRLITCGGPFDRSSGHYRDNIVVTASLTSR